VAHVLVISDSAALQVFLARLLREQGHTTSLAADGDAGFLAIHRSRPAVVVLDLREGDPDGMLFHGLLRKRHPDLPVLSLVADRLRLCDGRRDVLVDPSPADKKSALPILSALQRTVDELVVRSSLQTWKPAFGLA
jgi:CheY-like chemotaxis protein